MAKGKSSNPADAYRKALRKKELKKNKTERQKKREFALVKKDTGETEDEIAELEAIPEPSAIQKSRLTELRKELEQINKKKEEYVEAHPESRKLVYAAARRREQKKMDGEIELKGGLPASKGGKDEETDDDDIAMPAGPPPGNERNAEMEVTSDDDIFLPGSISEQHPETDFVPPLPPGPPPPTISALPYIIPSFPQTPIIPVHHIAGVTMGSHPTGSQNLYGPPRSTMLHSQAYFPTVHSSFPAGTVFPPPVPPGFFPRQMQRDSESTLQDPLSPMTVKDRKVDLQRKEIRGPSQDGPEHYSSPSVSVIKAASVDATVSAEPQLRDFKKESTSFVPSALRRRKTGGTSSSRINTAPELSLDSGIEEVEEATAPKPDLVGTLRGKFGDPPLSGFEAIHKEVAKRQNGVVMSQHDDYEKFLSEMGDVFDHPR